MEENGGVTFYRDGTRNYMVLPSPAKCRDHYQYRMLAANQIRGLLSCSSRCIDNQNYLYYDITSRQSLADIFDRRQVRGADLERLLGDLLRMYRSLTDYLLDVSHLILDPACIYADFREQEYSFAYFPGEEEKADWSGLFSFLADRVDGKDKQAAALAYRLCMMAEKPGFCLQPELLEDLGVPLPDGPSEHAGAVRPDIFEPVRPEADEDIGWYTQRRPEADRDLRKAPEQGWGENRYREAVGFPERGYDEEDRKSDSKGKPLRNPGRGLTLAGILMAAAGAGLLLAGFFLELEERALILARAAGAAAGACGIVLLIVHSLRSRRNTEGSRREERYEAEGNAFGWSGYEDETERKCMENSHAKTGYGSPGGYPGAGYTVEEAPRYDWIRENRTGNDRIHGRMDGKGTGEPGISVETTLLGSDPGRHAALYGVGLCRGEQIRLSRLPCVVGKLQDYVDQVLEDDSISRMHAKFSADREGNMTVRDLNSTNGTWLNGERLQPNESRELQQGDHLRLGRMEFVFR